jgi:hypothetical protein
MATGERQYQRRLGGGASGFTSYVLALGQEYKLLAENDIGETVMATPANCG